MLTTYEASVEYDQCLRGRVEVGSSLSRVRPSNRLVTRDEIKLTAGDLFIGLYRFECVVGDSE